MNICHQGLGQYINISYIIAIYVELINADYNANVGGNFRSMGTVSKGKRCLAHETNIIDSFGQNHGKLSP